MTTPITLTPSQQVALDHLLAAVARRENTSLQGVAGSGKTFLTSLLIERLREKGQRIMCAAPTHRALDVLRSRVPESIDCKTVASLLGLKPVTKGRFIQFIADFKQTEKRGQLRGINCLIVDESSMVSQHLGSELTQLCKSTGTVLVFVGDPAQLGPTDPPPGPGEDESKHCGVMAQAFLNPPGGVARLTEVVRHQGPVLELASAIRQCKTRDEINACWPSEGKIDAHSRIVVHDHAGTWMQSAKQVLLDPRWEKQPDSRIICYTNRECARLTQELRATKFGATAAEGWKRGECLQNGDSISQPGRSLAPPLAPSSSEWRVVDAEPYQLKLNLGTGKWFTPKTRAVREFEISCDLTVQKLVIDPLLPGGRQQRITVFAPVPGDPTWANRIAELRQQIAKIEAGKARTKAWSQWH